MKDKIEHRDHGGHGLPWGTMAVLSFLAMLFSLLVADSPTAFWLSFLAFLLCVIVCAVRWDDKKRDGSLPWWW